MRRVPGVVGAAITWGVGLLIVGVLVANPFGDPPDPPSAQMRVTRAIAARELVPPETVQCAARNAADGLYSCTAEDPLDWCLDADEYERMIGEPASPDLRADLASIGCGGTLREFDAAVDLGTGAVSYRER